MLFWRLYFPGDMMADEPETECSIGHVGRNDACLIAICKPGPDGREIVTAEPLNVIGAAMVGKNPEDYLRERGATPWMPIFYRKRSLSLEEVAAGAPSTTDLVVFGRGRKSMEDRLDITLWAITRDGKIIDCPEWAIDTTASEALVGVA